MQIAGSRGASPRTDQLPNSMTQTDCIEASSTVSALELTPWSQTPAQDIPQREYIDEDLNHPSPPFDINSAVNSKLAVFQGDFCNLLVDALINPTNEHLNDKNAFSKRLVERAGPQLKKDLQCDIKSCRTGEARITSGYDLLCQYVVHTVGPKYQQRYLSASESALYSSYRSSLSLMKEHNISTLAIPPLHSSRRGFPPVEGAHIALRTIRRFLEEFVQDPCVQRIVLLLDKVDLEIYSLLLPLYFPRTKAEQRRAMHGLPRDLGGKHGEPVIPERQIRIQDTPFFRTGENPPDFEDLDMSVCVGKSSFARMQHDVDNKRKYRQHEADSLTSEVSRKNRYERLLRKAKEMDFREIREANIIYRSGVDKFGRTVFIFVGRNYAPKEVSFEALCCYIIRLMDKEVAQPFVVVYLHSCTGNRNYMSYTQLREFYQTLDYRYKKNLQLMYIVHPTLWSRLSMWWFTTITTSGLSRKVRLLGGIEYLYLNISPDQLNVPQFVLDYDYSVNGARYYDFSPQPPANSGL